MIRSDSIWKKMTVTVHLNNKLGLRAIKIYNIRTYSILPSESPMI